MHCVHAKEYPSGFLNSYYDRMSSDLIDIGVLGNTHFECSFFLFGGLAFHTSK